MCRACSIVWVEQAARPAMSAVSPTEGEDVSRDAKLTRRLKGYAARQANRILGRTGEAFWQAESYDHSVRSKEEWVRIARDIENNPVAAGLAAKPEDYAWSSANPANAIRRQDCRRGAQDCALHIDPGTPSEMRAPRYRF